MKIWFGLAIYEDDWLSQQKGADLVIYAETYENQTNVLGQWTTSGPLMTRPAWADVTGAVRIKASEVPLLRHSSSSLLDEFTEEPLSDSSGMEMGGRLVHQSREKVEHDKLLVI